MSATNPVPPSATCPNCGVPLRPHAAVCASCGVVPALERLPRQMSAWAARRTRRRPSESEPYALIVWGLAVAPCLVAPPILAIALAWRTQTYDTRPRVDATWVTVVAMLNVVLSVFALVHFGHEILSVLSQIGTDWTPRSPPRSPSVTPI